MAVNLNLFDLLPSKQAAASAQINKSSGTSGSWGTPTQQYKAPIGPAPKPQVLGTATNKIPNSLPNIQQSVQQSEPRYEGPSDRELDEVYNPIFGALDSQGKQQKQWVDEDKAMMTENEVNQLNTLAGNKGLIDQSFKDQEGKIHSGIEDALNQAVRAYQAMQQGAQNRFGGASSAGQMMQELANREFLRQQGNIQKEKTNQFTQLSQSIAEANLWYSDSVNKVQTATKTELGKIVRNFENAMMQIENQRSMVQQEKAARKLAEIQKVKDFANSLALKRWEALENIKNYKMQLDAELEAGYNKTYDSRYQIEGNPFKQDQNLTIDERPAILSQGISDLAAVKKSQQNADEDEENGFFGNIWSF